MKIGFVLDDSLDKTDGVQQYITTLGHWMQSRGHRVHYIVGHTERSDIANVHSLGKNIQVHFNQNRMSTPLPVRKTEIKKLLEQERFDVLHVQLPYSPFLAGRIIKVAPSTAAIIGTFHILPYSVVESVATRLLAIWVRSTRKRFDRVISVSAPAARFAKKRFKLSSTVVPNAVHVQEYSSAKPITKYDDKKLTIVYLGRLVERKGCMQFLRAIEALHREHMLINVRILVAGKGPLREELMRFVETNQLKHVVHFLGYIPETKKPSLLASADIAVFPSTGGESFGIVLLEAMSTGRAVVIAGDNQGYRSVMGTAHDQLIDPDNTEMFSKTLKHYIRNSSARNKAIKWQTKHVQNYDVQVVGTEILSLYEETLLKKSEVR